MEGKKKYFALVLFLFLGLMIFTFANPVEDEKEFIDGDNEQSEKIDNKKEKNKKDKEITTEDKQETTEEQQNILNNVTNNTNNTNNNNGNTQNREEDYLGKAIAAVEKAEASYTKEDVESAKQLVNNVTDTTEKGKLQNRLEEVEAGIAVLELLENLEKQVEEADEKADMTTATSYRDENEIAKKIETLTNENVSTELAKRLAEVSKLLDDNAPPTVNVEAKGYQTNVIITAEDEAGNDFTLYLTKNNEEEKEIENNTATTSEGIYVLRVVDEAFNEKTVRFIVDGTDPVLKGLTNGGHYNEITIDVEDLSEVTIKVTNMDKNETTTVDNKTVLTNQATYKIEVTDEANNVTTYWVAIDTTPPTISGVTNNSIVNKSENAYIRDKFLTLVKVTAKYADGTETVEEFTRADFTVGARNENFEYKYRATKEGTYTIYAEDKYGNNYSETFTIDRTAAKKHAVNANVNGYKNDVKKQYATNGKTISAYISINEELKHNPTFTFYANGKEIKVMKDEVVKSNSTNKEYPYVYTATLEINEALVAEDGLVTFSVTDIYDKAGNKTDDITKMTTEKVITLDRTAAARVYSTIRSKASEVVHENGKDRDYYHKNGTEFEYAISFNELLAEVPTVTVAGRKVTMELNEEVLNKENKFLYEGTFKIAEDEAELPEGTLEIKVTDIKDLAGNPTTLADETKTSNGRRVIYDRTAATRMSADFYVNGLTQIEKTFYTQYGNTLVVNVTTNEQLGQVPTFTLHNNGKDYVIEGAIYRGLNDKGYHLYQASYELTKETGMTDGEITFTVSDIADIAGNSTNNVTEATNGRKVVLDNVVKTDKLAIIGKNGQWKDKEYIQYANTGTIIYVNARFKEELATTPVITLNEKVKLTKAAKKESNGIWIYSYSYKLTENDGLDDGTIQVKVTNIKDFAGNTTELTNENMTMESQSEVVVDRTLPTFRFTKAGSSLAKDEITPIVKDGVYYFNQYVRVTLSDSVNLRLHGINTYYDDKNAKRTGWLKDVKEDGIYTAVAVDAAGNRLEFKFVVDTTAPEIKLTGTEGRTANELRVESGTIVTLEDVIAHVTDNIDGEYTIKPYKADLLISNVASENVYNYDFSNGFNTRYIGRYNIYYKTKDTAGNESTATLLLVMTDTTQAEITLPEAGRNGRNQNEYRVESGTKVTVEDIMATVTDNVDETVKIKPYKADLLISNVASENVYNYDFSDGFNTRYIGRYNIYYTYTDKAGNTTNKTMLLVMTDTTAPTITIPGTAGLNKNEYIVEAGTHVTVDEIMATVTDNVDETVKIKPYRADLLIGTAAENTYNYDFTNGFDTVYPKGRYNLYYEYTDKAGHKTTAGMMIIIKDTTAPVIEITKANRKTYVRGKDLFNMTFYVYKENNLVHTVDSETSAGGSYFSVDWLGDGNYTVEVVDRAGNKSIEKFEVDTKTIYITNMTELKEAFANGGKAILLNDIEVTEMLTLKDGKELILDMNEKKLTINDTTDPMMDIKKGTKITITGNGTFDLEDHKYASLMYPRGEVIIQNGKFLRASGTNKNDYGSFFVGISGSGGAAKIRIYDGYFDGGYYVEGDEFNNSRTMLNGSWGQDIKIYGGTFVGQNPAYGDEGMAYTNSVHAGKPSDKTYCQAIFFDGQSRLDTEIPSTYKVEEGKLADGRPTFKVIYTPAE